jgi:hypothetical protein
MVFQLIRWVDLRRSLSTWRILKNMMFLLLQTDRFLHLQATLLKSVRPHPHRGQQLTRSQGWTASLHKKLVFRNCREDRERKLDGAAKMVGRLCAHFVCMPPFLPANLKEQAGRNQGFHNHVRDPRDGRRSCPALMLVCWPCLPRQGYCV